MKIGIIVYSQTENTYFVAQKLQEKLLVAGHEVNIEKVNLLATYTQDQKISNLKHYLISTHTMR